MAKEITNDVTKNKTIKRQAGTPPVVAFIVTSSLECTGAAGVGNKISLPDRTSLTRLRA